MFIQKVYGDSKFYINHCLTYWFCIILPISCSKSNDSRYGQEKLVMIYNLNVHKNYSVLCKSSDMYSYILGSFL